MAKRKNKNRKKSSRQKGEHGETVIKAFPDAVNALKYRYKKEFPDMTLFLNFNALGKNFIFQRFNSYPLTNIGVISEGNGLLLTASWKSFGALEYILPKSFFSIKFFK